MIRLHLRNSTVAALADGIQALFGKVPVSETLMETLMEVETLMRVFLCGYDPVPPVMVLHLTPEQCNALAAYCRPEPVRLAEFHAHTAYPSLQWELRRLDCLRDDIDLPSEGTLELWHRPAGPFPDVARMLPSHCSDLTPPAGRVPYFADDTPLRHLTQEQFDHAALGILTFFGVRMELASSWCSPYFALCHLETGGTVDLTIDATAWQAWKAAEKLDDEATL